jgi:hypothetical protein
MKIIINDEFSIVKKPSGVDNDIILAEDIGVVEQEFLDTAEQKITNENGEVVNSYEILGSLKIDGNTIFFIKFND